MYHKYQRVRKPLATAREGKERALNIIISYNYIIRVI
jgi:hypothetical protein